MKLFLAWVFFGAFFCLLEAIPVQERMDLVEGDMLLTKGQKEVYNQHKNGRVRRAAVAAARKLWPKGKIYYTFNRQLLTDNRFLQIRYHALLAMEHWQQWTCLQFIERTTQSDYIEFKLVTHPNESPCQSSVGKIGGKQYIVLGDTNRGMFCRPGDMIHEVGHAIGFYHEQNRPDRDKYVKVIDRLKGDRNYKKLSRSDVNTGSHEYDFDSIMQYPAFHPDDRNVIEINPIKREKLNFMGQITGVSFGDIAQTNDMYKCNDNDESQLDVPMDSEDGSGKEGSGKEGSGKEGSGKGFVLQ